jgi:hypothetical protein
MAISLKNMKQSKMREGLGEAVQDSAHAPPSTWDTGVNVKTPGLDKRQKVAGKRLAEEECFGDGIVARDTNRSRSQQTRTVADQEAPLGQEELSVLVACANFQRYNESFSKNGAGLRIGLVE